MGRMIYFMYTGNIRVTEVTVCQLLPAATMFQVPYVVDACCAFLERQLDPTNAIGISSFAEQHGCESLKQKANQFIERNFTQVGVLVFKGMTSSFVIAASSVGYLPTANELCSKSFNDSISVRRYVPGGGKQVFNTFVSPPSLPP